MTTQPLELSQISLRCVKGQGAERGLVVGGVGSGKSVLSEMLGRDWVARYYSRGARRLILDTKPRFRAEKTARGWSASPRYRSWDHGQAVPGSIVVDEPDELDLAWSLGFRTAIVQCEDESELPRVLATAERFYRQARARRPQLLQVDETMDFFHTNTMPKGGSSIIVRSARSGRERSHGCLFASQRTKEIPTILLKEMTRLYLFVLDSWDDGKRLPEMGAPVREQDVPTEVHEFRYWVKYDRRRLWPTNGKTYKLALSSPAA